MSDYLEKVLEIHAGQLNKVGKPYILHPLRLMLRFNRDDDIITAAFNVGR